MTLSGLEVEVASVYSARGGQLRQGDRERPATCL